MRLIKISNYIPKEVDTTEFLTQMKESLKKYYKGSMKWFNDNYEKILKPGNINWELERQFIIIYDADNECKLAGFALLKVASSDQKIATLYVAKEYRNKGIGTDLLKSSARLFNCNSQPYIFFNDKVLLDFPLFPFFLCKNDFVYDGKKDEQHTFIYQGITGEGYDD